MDNSELQMSCVEVCQPVRQHASLLDQDCGTHDLCILSETYGICLKRRQHNTRTQQSCIL